jgi:hypothetical protein
MNLDMTTSEFMRLIKERYNKDYLSYSSLKNALGDMRMFDMYMKKETKKKSDALTFGSLYDMMLFEPDRAKSHYVILNDNAILDQMSEKARSGKNPKATNEWKNLFAEYEFQVHENGQEIASVDDWTKSQDMIDRLHASGLYGSYLDGADFQVEFNEYIDGIKVRGFFDCVNGDMVVDSKSSRSMDKFRYDVRSFSYDIQAYIYCRVMDTNKFYWLVQEKNYPYYPGIVRCTEETLFSGEMKFNEAIGRIATFLGQGIDYDYSKDYAEFSV